MAFQTSETKLIGREANIIGYLRRYDNEYLARHYPGPPHDPKTPAQIIIRNKLAFASTFVSNLGKVGREIQAANGIARQWRKHLVGKVMKCFPVELPDPPFPCRLPLIDTPGIKVDYPQMSLVRKGNTLTLHVGIQAPPAYRLHRCATAIVVYNTTKNLWLSASNLCTDLSDLTLHLPKSWLADTLLPAAFILPSFEPLHAPAPDDPYSNKLDDLQQVLWAPLRYIYTTTSPRPFTSSHLHTHRTLVPPSTSLRPLFDSTSHHQHPLFISPFPHHLHRSQRISAGIESHPSLLPSSRLLQYHCNILSSPSHLPPRAFQRRSRRHHPQPTISTIPSASSLGSNSIPSHLPLPVCCNIIATSCLSLLRPSQRIPTGIESHPLLPPIPSHCNIPSFSLPPFPTHLRRTSRPRLPFHRQSPTICPQPPIPVHFSDVFVAATPTLPSASPPLHLRTRLL